MIKISEDTYNNPLFSGDLSTYLLNLYTIFSVNPLPEEVDIPNEYWKECIEILYKCNKQNLPKFNIKPELIRSYSYNNLNENKVILALSGGKDSAANLVRLLDEGKEVTCYFMQKANLSYSLEEGKAQQIADLYNVELLIDNLGRSGKTDYHDNPMKNSLIMIRMLEYGLRNNCSIVSLGEFWGTDSSTCDIQHDFNDSIDFLQAFEHAIQSHIPEFKFDFFWQEECTGMSYIINYHKEVIPYLQSCLMPTRYLKQQLKHIEKYHLHANILDPLNEGIMEGRCMSCWKCIAEWIYLVLWHKLPYNKDYMENKALPTLIKHLNEIDSELASNKEQINTKSILNALLDLDYLNKYFTDPNTILDDIKHSHKELDRK